MLHDITVDHCGPLGVHVTPEWGSQFLVTTLTIDAFSLDNLMFLSFNEPYTFFFIPMQIYSSIWYLLSVTKIINEYKESSELFVFNFEVIHIPRSN